MADSPPYALSYKVPRLQFVPKCVCSLTSHLAHTLAHPHPVGIRKNASLANDLHITGDGRAVFRRMDKKRNGWVSFALFQSFFQYDDRLFRTQEHEERIRRQQEEDEEIELRLEKAEKRALRAAEESQWELDEIARLEAVEREEAARALARERLIGSACGRSAKANARRLAIFDAIDTDRDDTITVGEVRVDSFLVYLRPIAKFGIVKCVQRDLY